jgi:hypothetical protein
MSDTTQTSKLSETSSRRQKIVWTRIQINVPQTIYRVYAHPLLGFAKDDLGSAIHDSSDLPLENVPLTNSSLSA